MNRTRIFVAVGIAVAAGIARQHGNLQVSLRQERMVEQSRLQTVGIVAAVVDIPLGSTINPNQVAISAWPKDNYPKDAIVDLKTAVGRIALRDFFRGEPVVESKLVPLNKTSGLLALKVPCGNAGVLRQGERGGRGGRVHRSGQPGGRRRHDVPIPKAQQEKVSKIVLEDVRVLAAGQTIEQKDNKPVTVNTVTLALTPG